MRNFLVIYKGIIVDIVTKDGNFISSDTKRQFDTIGEDPSGKFKTGDTYTTDQYDKYNMDPVEYFKKTMPMTMPMVDYKAALDDAETAIFEAAASNTLFAQNFLDMLNSDTYDRSILNAASRGDMSLIANLAQIKQVQDTVFYNYYYALANPAPAPAPASETTTAPAPAPASETTTAPAPAPASETTTAPAS